MRPRGNVFERTRKNVSTSAWRENVSTGAHFADVETFRFGADVSTYPRFHVEVHVCRNVSMGLDVETFDVETFYSHTLYVETF